MRQSTSGASVGSSAPWLVRFDSRSRRSKSIDVSESENDEYRDMVTPLAALVDRLDSVSRVKVGPFDQPNGRNSAETLIVPITATTSRSTQDRATVLCREMSEHPACPVQVAVDNEIEIQWRVMSTLAVHADVPIAPLLGYEADTESRSPTSRSTGRCAATSTSSPASAAITRSVRGARSTACSGTPVATIKALSAERIRRPAAAADR